MSDDPSSPSRFALILAGGSGQRFWPVSRESRPKQLLQLFGGKTLLELTIERLEGLIPLENILVLTNRQQEAAVRDVASCLPAENIVAEPEKRDTAPAIALAVGVVAARDPEATMVVLPSDHLIQDREAFQSTLTTTMLAAEESKSLVTIGIKPTWPCPSYGYVERGANAGLKTCGPNQVFDVEKFREKPDPELAAFFLEQGTFTWNAGMFIWTVPAILNEMSQHCEEYSDFVSELRHADDLQATIASQFPKLPKLSIDYALMEKASRVLNVEATFDWDDVGNWTSVGRHLDTDGYKNQANAALSQLDSNDNIVFTQTGQHVALLGVNDLIVVSTGDALLVAAKADAERIKKLVDGLPESLR